MGMVEDNTAVKSGTVFIRRSLSLLVPDRYEDASAFRQTEWVDVNTISVTIIANVALALLCLAYFWSSRKHNAGYFSSKRRRLPSRTPPNLPCGGFFSWIWPLLAMTEDDILRYAGFDAVIFLRFYKLAFKVFGVFSFYGLLVIVPANIQGGSRSSSYEYQTNINTFNRLSMSNIQHYDPRMWLHALGVYGLTGITMYFLIKEYRFYTTLRHKFMRRKAAHLRTIMVEGVPHEMRSNTKLFTYFNTLYPDEVVSVHTPQDISHLRKLLDLRHEVIAQLRGALERKAVRGQEQYHTLGIRGLGQRVNTVDYCSLRLQRLNEAIAKEQSKKKRKQRMAYAVRAQSISVVDMNYDLGSMPEREAGPIERLVLEEDGHSESDSESSSSSHGVVVRTRRSGTGEGQWWSGSGGSGTAKVLPRSPRMSMDLPRTGDSARNRGWVQKSPTRSDHHRRRSQEHVVNGGRPRSASVPSERTSLLTTEMKDLDALATKLPQKRKRNQESDQAPRAFVIFKSFGAATVARQVLHCARPGRMAAMAAPEPRDVYWKNIFVTRRQHKLRWLTVEVLLFTLMLFFPVLVTFLSFVISAESLMQRSEVIKNLCAQSTLFESLVELLQPLSLIILMATLPRLLRWVGHLEGNMAESWNQMTVLSRYFSFQVLNVFLITTVAGSAFEVITRLMNHPSDVFMLLGETLPKVCGFFCNYVIIRTFTGLSIELVRAYLIGPALLRAITCWWKWGKTHVKDTTDKNLDNSPPKPSSGGLPPPNPYRGARPRVNSGPSKNSYTAPSPTYVSPASKQGLKRLRFYYGQLFAQDLLVVVVVMTYACMAPVVLIAALMFFGYAQIIYRHQLLYVYVPAFESGGSFFPKVFRRWVFALFTAQATMLGMCLLKTGFKQATSLGLLMVLTYIFKRKMREMYEPVSFCLPLEMATGLDLDLHRVSSTEGEVEMLTGEFEWDGDYLPNPDEYMQPELTEPAYLQPEQLFGDLAIKAGTFL